MEMVVQLCLTACATHSLTNYVTASYGLWEWLARSSLFYGNGFTSGTSNNQQLHKGVAELGYDKVVLRASKITHI